MYMLQWPIYLKKISKDSTTLDMATAKTSRKDIIIVTSDWNTKIGSDNSGCDLPSADMAMIAEIQEENLC